MWPWQCHWTGWDQAWRGNQHSSLSHNPEHQQALLGSQHSVAVSKNSKFSTPAPLCHPLRVASAPQLQLPSCEQAGQKKGSLQIFRDFQCLELFCESALNTEVLSYSTIVIFFFLIYALKFIVCLAHISILFSYTSLIVPKYPILPCFYAFNFTLQNSLKITIFTTEQTTHTYFNTFFCSKKKTKK